MTDIDSFGFLPESEIDTDSDRSESGSIAKDSNRGPLRPVTAPQVDDDVFPSEETEPLITPRRDETAPVADADFPRESGRDRGNEHAGRLFLALWACVVALAAFIGTRQALGLGILTSPPGMAVPAPVVEEPPSSVRPSAPPTSTASPRRD